MRQPASGTYTGVVAQDAEPADRVVDLEVLSARLHDIYQVESHRRGDIRHADRYEQLPEMTKEWDRVLARWILEHWTPRFDPSGELPAP